MLSSDLSLPDYILHQQKRICIFHSSEHENSLLYNAIYANTITSVCSIYACVCLCIWDGYGLYKRQRSHYGLSASCVGARHRRTVSLLPRWTSNTSANWIFDSLGKMLIFAVSAEAAKCRTLWFGKNKTWCNQNKTSVFSHRCWCRHF